MNPTAISLAGPLAQPRAALPLTPLLLVAVLLLPTVVALSGSRILDRVHDVV